MAEHGAAPDDDSCATSSLQLIVSQDPIERAGLELARALESVLAERETVRLAVPGGSALAALLPARTRLGESWSRVRLTWVDERCVAGDDAESNRGLARRIGLPLDVSHADGEGPPLPASVLPLYLDGESPQGAVERVVAALEADFDGALDVSLLGMGEDGHIASLFPGHPLGAREDESVAHVSSSPKPPADRITLTLPTLRSARHSVLLAAGEAKRAALLRLLSGDPELPAQGLRGLVIVTDLDLSEA